MLFETIEARFLYLKIKFPQFMKNQKKWIKKTTSQWIENFHNIFNFLSVVQRQTAKYNKVMCRFYSVKKLTNNRFEIMANKQYLVTMLRRNVIVMLQLNFSVFILKLLIFFRFFSIHRRTVDKEFRLLIRGLIKHLTRAALCRRYVACLWEYNWLVCT